MSNNNPVKSKNWVKEKTEGMLLGALPCYCVFKVRKNKIQSMGRGTALWQEKGHFIIYYRKEGRSLDRDAGKQVDLGTEDEGSCLCFYFFQWSMKHEANISHADRTGSKFPISHVGCTDVAMILGFAGYMKLEFSSEYSRSIGEYGNEGWLQRMIILIILAA